jgi:GMP synthase (glutamine-hydrolysing)
LDARGAARCSEGFGGRKREEIMARIVVLQHHRAEGLGTIGDALATAAHAWQYVRSFDGQPVPKDLKGAGGLILMGGPMGVYEEDRYPWLRDEMRLVESAIKEGKPVLGICLGSQLIAAALGARVFKGASREIGWYPVALSAAARDDRIFGALPRVFTPCHWHGDIFDLPSGAVALASSEKTAFQAFRYGDCVWAVLFHLELTAEIIAKWVGAFANELRDENLDPAAILADTNRFASAAESIGQTLFAGWAALPGSR